MCTHQPLCPAADLPITAPSTSSSGRCCRHITLTEDPPRFAGARQIRQQLGGLLETDQGRSGRYGYQVTRWMLSGFPVEPYP